MSARPFAARDSYSRVRINSVSTGGCAKRLAGTSARRCALQTARCLLRRCSCTNQRVTASRAMFTSATRLHKSPRWNISSAVRAANCTVLTLAMRIIQISAPGLRHGGLAHVELRDAHPGDAVAQIGASRQAALCLPRQRGCTNQRAAGSRRGGERRYELRGATPATETARISASLHYGSAGRGAPDAMRCRVRKWEFV